MKKATILLIFAATLSQGSAFAQSRSANHEVQCTVSGSGMDPRCVGDTTSGTESDRTAVSGARNNGQFSGGNTYNLRQR